jgi:hypothetical protein
MRLKQSSTTAVVVRRSWANLQAVQSFLRHCPTKKACSDQAADDSQTILARVLDDRDSRGLWIQLNTKEHEQDPAVELQALMIPWPEVLAVVVAHDFGSVIEKKGNSPIQLESDNSHAAHSHVSH